ncbi:MAG: GntR family transcriptional regulator [Alphaproteobacteria bacterium]|nr:GntR family transcriptional regulator [Alphaproteobacteria bacterium]
MPRGKPRHERIAEDLIAAIAAGRPPVGGALPTEHELSAAYGVSRFTVAQALDRLKMLGLISQRPRRGTRVLSRFPVSTRNESGGTLQEWTGYGRDFVLEIERVEERAPPPELARVAGAAGRRWLSLEGVRRAKRSRAPICFTEILVHPDYKDIRAEITRTPPLIFGLIEARHGPLIRLVRHELVAVGLPARMARVLDAPAGSPALRTTRSYLAARGRLVERVVNTHPHDRFAYVMEVTRGIPDNRKQEDTP